jgi:CubicO group peptidase (beta-lactamase class C family)
MSVIMLRNAAVNRRRFLVHASAGLAAAVSGRASLRAQTRNDRASEIDRLMTELHERRMFTGAILVAAKGSVIYTGGFGLADRSTKHPYTPDTRSCLASLSKPITATAVMMLAEKRELNYDDTLGRFLPGFTDAVGNVTLRHLLAHTSGIPDYPDLNADRPGVTNAEIVEAIRKVQAPAFPPGQKYEYCNGGYVLLALIVEKLSGLSLPRFLDDRIFGRLGMSSTFVLTNASQKTAGVARGYDDSGKTDDFEGMSTGDGGVYSTVKDLLRFDQALYTDTLVKQSTLADAFTPAVVREGQTTYGLGWNINGDVPGKRVWHQGNTAGFRAFIERRLRDRITVIMLTNGGNTNRMAINDRIQKILAA